LAAVGAMFVCPAQPPAPLTFDVASVRVADRQPPRRPFPAGGEITGGPGSSDPTRLTYSWVSMWKILASAFGVADDRIENRPEWTGQERFDIAAKVPPGATAEQVQEMLQNLLKDRFHLAYHRAKKEIDAYTLAVAKGGPKLKAAMTSAPGFQRSTKDGVMRMTFQMSSPADLATRLGRGVIPIVDATGLTGPYDFTLEYGVESMIALVQGATPIDDGSDPAPDTFTTLEKQLGLKLEKGKTQIDVVAIDHLDKIPTEN